MKKSVTDLVDKARQRQQKVNVFIDIDNGMHRTGIEPEPAFDFAVSISMNSWLNLGRTFIFTTGIFMLLI